MSEKTIVFFDLDDTIINLTKIHKEAINSGFEKAKSIDECVKKYISIYNQTKYANPKEIFEKVFGGLNTDSKLFKTGKFKKDK